jgi:hypothetical protein
MPSLFPMAPMKWKAGSGEEDDEGCWQRCHGLPEEGEVKPDLSEN